MLNRKWLFCLLFLIGHALNGYSFTGKKKVGEENKPVAGKVDQPAPMVYHDALQFQVIGQLPGCTGYARLPETAKTKVRQPVYNLSINTAGVGIRFNSDAGAVSVKWTLTGNGSTPHITATAYKGLDLYAFVNGQWEFVGLAKPSGGNINQAEIISGMTHENREYLLNLPLYDGVTKLEIGVDGNITKPLAQIIDTLNPIVVYGTSITQGASASRPGMMYSSLLSRNLNREVINLGFSGNGFFEVALGEYIMSANPSLLILDCAVNSDSATIMKNAPALIDFVKTKNKDLHILFVESIMRENAYFKTGNGSGSYNFITKQNQALKTIFKQSEKKYTNLHYLTHENLIGDDHEGTIDGTHLNDLGFYRMYLVLSKEVSVILKLKKKKKKKK